MQHFRSTATWLNVHIHPSAHGVLVYLRDVTARVDADFKRRDSDARVRLLLTQVPAVLWTLDARGRYTSVEGAASRAEGGRSREVVGLSIEDVFEGDGDLALRVDAFRRALAGEALTYETCDGASWTHHHVTPLSGVAGEIVGVIGVSQDVTEIKRREEQMALLARRDALTGLPNRLALGEGIERALADASTRGERLAVLFVDLDRFKAVNDTFGHRVGDLLLVAVAGRLSHSVRGDSLVARSGGDEFIIVARNVQTDAALGALAGRIVRELSAPFILEGHELSISASVGASVFPDDGESVELLLKRADGAMYGVKAAGRNGWRSSASSPPKAPAADPTPVFTGELASHPSRDRRATKRAPNEATRAQR